MAIFSPTLDKLEIYNPDFYNKNINLINTLKKGLNDTFYIYLEPCFNGESPDIVVMNSLGNIYMLEICDMNLDNYSYTPNFKFGEFNCKETSMLYPNPFRLINQYKNDIFELHIENLFMIKERRPKIFGSIKNAIFFTKFNTQYLNKFFNSVPYDVTYIDILGYDSDIIQDIKSFCRKKNYFMTQEIFDEFHRLFKPSYHHFYDGKYVNLTNKQKELVVSEASLHKKIRGLSGSGKTLVLSHRAVNAAKRTNSKVLILTFNITLTNYIKERLSAVRADFNWNSFIIKHYHGFIKYQCIKHGIKYFTNTLGNVDNSINDNFNEINAIIDKYDVILIDEGQDFEKEWFDNLKNNFLKPDGEFIIFADEKQNIYDRELANDKKPSTNIIGRWNELSSESFRLGFDVVDLANKFQIEFFKEKYDVTEIETALQFTFESQDLLYGYDEQPLSYSEIFDTAFDYIRKMKINNNNVTIISNKIEDIRELEYYARHKYKLLIETTFETKEEYDELLRLYPSLDDLDKKLRDKRRCRKFNFKLNNYSRLKMSTIHSFKGWETDVLVVIIDEDTEKSNLTPELLYTAITRCIKHLIIYNRGNMNYHEFFKKNMSPFSELKKDSYIPDMPVSNETTNYYEKLVKELI